MGDRTRMYANQKTPSSSTPIPSGFVHQRPFPVPVQDTSTQPEQPIDLQAKLEIARRVSPDLTTLKFSAPRPPAGPILPSLYREPVVAADQRPSIVQAKLTVGAPNDQYEQEADHVADQVMSMPDATVPQPVQREAMSEEEEVRTKPLAASITPLIQREEMPEEDEKAVQPKAIASIQREALSEEDEETNSIQPKTIATSDLQREEMPEEDEETNSIQPKTIATSDLQREEMPEEEGEMQRKPLSHSTLQRSPDGSLQAGSDLESRLSSSQGGGSPLPNDVRSFMETRFGADFSQVRVHTGSESVQMNRDLNAQAFTHKQDVYFGAGKAPAKDALTAHELTHVVQQTGKVQRQGIPSDKESGGNVRFLGFLNTGTGITKRPLGSNLLTPYMTNGVELQFEVASSIFNKFQNIRPVQWAGPGAVWIKQGNPITQPWQNYLQDAGTGSDDPEGNIVKRNNTIAYWDSPGPNMEKHARNSRVHAVQNFTGWIVGEPKSGGQPQQLSEVVAWNSVVSVGNFNWSELGATPNWQRMDGNQAGLGWTSTNQPTTI